MKAVVFAGPGQVRVDEVAHPEVSGDNDIVVQVHRTAICGSDLHLLDGKTPGMRAGSVIGHEFVGVVAETGRTAADLEGRRVVGSFLIACGICGACAARRYNLCRNGRALGLGTLTGDLDGAQAEYVLVPDARINVKPLAGELATLSDEQALFAGDVMTTGFYAASLTDTGAGDSVAVLGAGPVGLFTAGAISHAGARALLLDLDPERVRSAQDLGFDAVVPGDDAGATCREVLGEEPAAAVDAVGSVPALKSALRCVRDGGVVVVVGVYGAERYELPLGRVWVRALDIRFSGLANVQAHWDTALAAVTAGVVQPERVISHRLPLDQAIEGYELFRARVATKVVLEP